MYNGEMRPAGTPYPPQKHGGKRRRLAEVNAFFTKVEEEVQALLQRFNHLAADKPGRLSFVDFSISDHGNEDVGVFVKVSLARVLPTAFTDKITDIDHYIKGDVYSSICSFRENGQETVKMYEIFLLERLQRCESAELLDGIIEEVAETVSRYAHYAQSIKNSDSILQWRNSAILMINKHISTEMLPVSECTYLPGAMLPAASSIEEKQNLLLNILLMGAVKMAYPREVLQMFGVNCPDERNFVLQKYNGLLFIVRSLLSDLEKAGNISFRDEVLEQAKTSLNMGHFDFDRFLGEEEVEEVEEEESAETVKDVLLEQVVPVEERSEGNATEETQAVFYQGIFHAAVTLRSLQGVNMIHML